MNPYASAPWTRCRRARVMVDDMGQGHARENEQADGPEDGAAEQARREASALVIIGGVTRYPSPRTVSMNDAPSFRRSRAMKTSTVFESRSRSCA